MASRNPPWAREEPILALDLYFQVNPIQLSPRSAEVIKLSETLNQLPIVSDRPDRLKFRNPNGVYMKLCNFLSLDPDYPGTGLAHGGRLEKEIWDEFANNRALLHSLAQTIMAAANMSAKI